MREIHTHKTNRFNSNNIEVSALDAAGAGGACHHYRIDAFVPAQTSNEETISKAVVEFQFQNGPIKEAGVNGVTDESLFAILIDRLQGFQKGQYSCRENAVALTHLETSLLWLQHRTRAREARGVEGTSTV